MIAPSGEVLQVLGRARAGDPVTATARSLHAHLGRVGLSSRVTAGDPGPAATGIDRFDSAVSGPLVVHTVDGGQDLAGLVGHLVDRPLTVVHHGSAPGSDRSTLRMLRGATRRAVAADAAAREELRGLGFGAVGVLDPRVADDAFTGIVADDATAANLARHPGPLLVSIGPIAPHRGVETLITAFVEVVTHSHPGAVLSFCGPSSRWYRARLHRHVTTRGLHACEIVEPAGDGEVLARLDRADAVVSLRPCALDPYVRHAARQGLAIVAPATSGHEGLESGAVLPVAPDPRAAELATALARALDRPRPPAPASAHAGELTSADLCRLLGLS